MDSKWIARWKRFLIISFLTIFFFSCSSFEQSNIQAIYKSDFSTPTIKISNLSGERDSIDYPGGTLSVAHYRFNSEGAIKIKDRKKYRKVNSITILDYLMNKALLGTKDSLSLRAYKKDAICLYSEEKFPLRLAGREQISKIITVKKWIVLWLKGKTYFVVRVQEDKSFHSQ